MLVRVQWVVERCRANRLVREVEALGATLRGRSETDPLPADLDAFADMEEELLSIVELDIEAEALIDLVTRAIEAQDPGHLLVVDHTRACLQIRQLPVHSACGLVVRDPGGNRALRCGQAWPSRRLARYALEDEGTPPPAPAALAAAGLPHQAGTV